MPPDRSSRLRFPSWIITFVLSMVVFLAIASSVQRLSSSPGTSGDPPAVAPAPAPDAPPEPSEPEYPMARFVEVSGLHVVDDAGGPPQVQYTVVNRSASDLEGIGLRIAVRSGAAPAGSPLFVLSARVPKLAAYQSKEIRVSIDSQAVPARVPGAENLRTEVKVLSQP